MSYIVLARKWRPQQFEDLIGQEAIARTLKNAIQLTRVPHALLFTGTRGVGKTTTARIFAKALNCEKGPTPVPCGQCSNCKEIAGGSNIDVREIDGASNTSVDDVRELRENVRYAPSKSRNKIYIIDEVHMLSTSAFNALLKTLEEPPSGVLFIFATTEPHKIPDTILSRCQRFDFRQISEVEIARHLRKVIDHEEIRLSDSALSLVARQAEGSLRDALSLLDQVIAFAGKEALDEQVVSILGLADRALISKTIDAFVNYDSQASLSVLDEVLTKGFDPKSYLLEIWERVRDLLILKSGANDRLIRLTKEELQRLKDFAQKLSEAELERWFDLLRFSISDIGRVAFPRYVMEVTFLKITREEARIPLSQLTERLEALEKKLSENPIVSKAATPMGGASKIPSTKFATPSCPPASWEKVLDIVKKQKPSFASILLQAQKVQFGEGKIALTFEEGSFFVTRAKEVDFQTYLFELTKDLFGEAYLVEVQTERKRLTGKDQKGSSNREIEREALQNPAISKAISLFGAKIEEIKPLK